MAKERFDTGDDMLHYCRHLLFRATQEHRHPMRTAAIGTIDSGQKWPLLRTVVLREVNIVERLLLFYTDARSTKIEHLLQNAHLSWLFWDPKKQIQIRARTRATLHRGDALARRHWRNIEVEGRKNYAARRAPGTPAEEATRDLPGVWVEEPSKEATEYAFDHFMVVVTEIREIDGLFLHPEGHQRIIYRWVEAQNMWEGGWVVA